MSDTLIGNEQTHAAAVIAVLNAALPAAVRAYDSDAVPTTPPAKYVEVTVSRRFGGTRRSSGNTATGGWRITTRVIDQNSITNARLTANTVRTALEFVRLSIGTKTSTPVQFETAEVIGPDDGWWSGMTAYTYAL